MTYFYSVWLVGWAAFLVRCYWGVRHLPSVAPLVNGAHNAKTHENEERAEFTKEKIPATQILMHAVVHHRGNAQPDVHVKR